MLFVLIHLLLQKEKYYCSQIVVTGIDDENESDLDSLLNNGFEVVRSCACDGIRILGRSTPLTPEERVQSCEGDIVDESGGLGTGLNYIIDVPIATRIIPNSVKYPIREEKTIIQGSYIWTYEEPIEKNKVKIAIIDTGIDFEHEYLKDFRWENEMEVTGVLENDEDGNCLYNDKFGYNFADESFVVNDENGHGTHVAGIISRSLNVELMDLKVFNEDGGDAFNLVCALQYAIDKKAEIINLSLGYYASETSIILDNMFQKVADAGILVITSAGNEGHNNDNYIVGGEQFFHFPSSFNQKYRDNIIAVAATKDNPKDELWKYSNYGKKHVDVAARGKNVVSTYIDPLEQYSGPPFISLNGTSMAAAQVSAVVANEMSSSINNINKQTITNRATISLPDSILYGIIIQ